jgi:Contact-dependent growth inhibition CdiA C-terminal domain
MHTNHALFEAFDDKHYTKIYFDTETGGFVVAHRKHGLYELKGNTTIAMMLVKHGYRIILLENDHSTVSADATLDGEVWEFKTISTSEGLNNRVQKAIKNGKRQANNILVFINQTYKTIEITKGIYNAIKFDEKGIAKKIGILFQNGRLIMMARVDVIDESFVDKFPED